MRTTLIKKGGVALAILGSSVVLSACGGGGGGGGSGPQQSSVGVSFGPAPANTSSAFLRNINLQQKTTSSYTPFIVPIYEVVITNSTNSCTVYSNTVPIPVDFGFLSSSGLDQLPPTSLSQCPSGSYNEVIIETSNSAIYNGNQITLSNTSYTSDISISVNPSETPYVYVNFTGTINIPRTSYYALSPSVSGHSPSSTTNYLTTIVSQGSNSSITYIAQPSNTSSTISIPSYTALVTPSSSSMSISIVTPSSSTLSLTVSSQPTITSLNSLTIIYTFPNTSYTPYSIAASGSLLYGAVMDNSGNMYVFKYDISKYNTPNIAYSYTSVPYHISDLQVLNGSVYGVVQPMNGQFVSELFVYYPSTNSYTTITSGSLSNISVADIQAANGMIYGDGTISSTAGSTTGVIFTYNPSNSAVSVYTLPSGIYPDGFSVSNNIVYGGANSSSTITLFEYNLSSSSYTSLTSFIAPVTNVTEPKPDNIQVYNGVIYGIINPGLGSIPFTYNIANNSLSSLTQYENAGVSDFLIYNNSIYAVASDGLHQCDLSFSCTQNVSSTYQIYDSVITVDSDLNTIFGITNGGVYEFIPYIP